MLGVMSCPRPVVLSSLVLLLPLACGDDSTADGGNAEAADTGDTGGHADTADTAAEGSEAEAGTGDGDGDPSGDGDGDPSGDGDGDPSGDGDGDPSGDGDGDPDCWGGGEGQQEYDFSILWVANSPEGTVSKIDTFDGVELARYYTDDPALSPDPSRTSVNLRGDVAVANRRSGSVIMIATRVEDCVDLNNNGTIETSQGPSDILAWGTDECVLWKVDLPGAFGQANWSSGPRAVAWTGEFDQDCNPTPRLWVGWRDAASDTGRVRRLTVDGEVDGDAEFPNWDDLNNFGVYGGGVDQDGDFWGIGKHNSALVHVTADNLEAQRFDNPSNTVLYGMAVDEHGAPWIAGAWDDDVIWRFDRDTETWENHGQTGHTHLRGMTVDSFGRAWFAANIPCGLTHFDTVNDTMVESHIALPGCNEPVGVTVDALDYVWVIDRGANLAYRVDPDTYETTTVGGLVGPYTYSDMTGFGLNLVVPQ
jgi:hypothetical protein